MKRRRFLQAAALTPLALSAAPQDDLRAKFEAKRTTDPVAAFRLLAESPGGPASEIARSGLARQIGQDLAAGLKAVADGKADVSETLLARAAQLAAPYSPDFSRQVLRAFLQTRAPRKTVTGCATCKGGGSAPCAACTGGTAPGPCPLCDAKGSVACLLCEGAGTLDHRGYKGTLVLSIDRDTKASVKDDKGKMRSGTLFAQTLTYGMSPCSGGSFPLKTDSAPVKGDRKTSTLTQPCSKFWTEMKFFAFSGKAKVKVNDPKGQLRTISSSAARRFFSDYEICTGGRVACERCTGKKTDVCTRCAGKGQALLLCAACDGTSSAPCPACKGVADASFLKRVLPAATGLSAVLAEQAAALKAWLDERAHAGTRKADLVRRLEEAKKGADPTAKFNAEAGWVDVACPRCKGSGGDCEECWGGGRREYTEGTIAFERYALVERLTRQTADALGRPPAPPPALPPLPEAEAGAAPVAGPATPVPAVKMPAAAPLAIPATVEEMIRKADQLHETGKTHLEKSKGSADNAVWIDEGMKAVQDLRSAQTLYASAQDKLDETGQAVPRTLLDKFRTNMQALVMARKQVP